MRHLLPLQYIDAVARTGSIRRAAETLNITSTALNRRILAMEEELGVPIFERLPRGVRLSTAGELLIHHIRAQISDLERVRGQIADLSGVRRGHVTIACSQAFLPFFLPEMIARYRREHPGVTFSVQRRDRAQAEQALMDHEVDLALIFEPVRIAEFQTIARVRQPVHVIMAPGHPLAEARELRLRDCVQHPLALPEPEYGVRHLLELACRAKGFALEAAVESDSFEFLRMHAVAENMLTFQIPVGLPHASEWPGALVRALDPRDVPPGVVALGQLRGRVLPVAASRFAQQMAAVFEERFDAE
ncbi:LysR family transcriptional regulator [Albimonas sp. CAU 1670]|uniref:LysR family transcriptional regulator n=1 Tax=Albimonas sp. CAU 1670 TaxID=3032599 RepID=UPI0023D981ED|nr:LysR family transcriptional regulator [Albimonas sp. CAU 1670]MDF2232893.1 LysR family transcriptional regulator [Albimonas sp. CAU 1670]